MFENMTAERGLELLETYGLPLLWAIVILILGRFVAKIITSIFKKWANKAKFDPTVVRFFANILYFALIALVIIAALDKVGVNTTSFAAVIAAAGLAIGLALQGSLSNFASGVMLIIFRPFKVGDYVNVGGVGGSVEEIEIFTTKLITPDNKVVIIPNGQITTSSITNFSANDTRRVDLVVGVSYDDDIRKVRQVLTDIINGDERILKEPAVTIAVLEMADSSVNFAVRPWVKSEDYWGVFFDLQEKIKIRFDEENITIPYPQTDIHIKKEE